MDVGHAAGAANAAAAAAHVAPVRPPVEQFVAEVEPSTESSSDAGGSRAHAQDVLAHGQGHKHGIIKHLSDDDLAALVSMTGVVDASAQVNSHVEETADGPDLFADVANRAENASAFSERVTQNLLAEVARREEAAAPVAEHDVAVEPDTSPVAEAASEAARTIDLSAKTFPDPTLATLLQEMAQIEAPDATQAAQLA